MHILVYSKNRPAQLDMLLRSLKANASDYAHYDITVLYDFDLPRYNQGYSLVTKYHPEVKMERQQLDNLKGQIVRCLESSPSEFFSFFADDLVVIRPFSLTDPIFHLLRATNDLAAVSLRLNPNVDYAQPINRKVRAPKLDKNNEWTWKAPRLFRTGNLHPRLDRHLRWLLRVADGDWSLPYILDGNVYRRKEMLAYFQSFPQIPRVIDLEPLMTQRPPEASRLVCYPQSRIVSLAMNTNDKVHNYPAGTSSMEQINEKFLTGERLDFTPWKEMNNTSCHYVAEPVWEKAATIYKTAV